MSGSTDWFSIDLEKAYQETGSTTIGLQSVAAEKRLADEGPNQFGGPEKPSAIKAFLSQFKSPILLLLIFAAVLSGFLSDVSDSITILAIVVAASFLSFWQEFQADASVRELMKLVQTLSNVRRDGKPTQIPVAQVVRGDVVLLEAGSAVPGDGLVTSSNNLLLNESSLTGESAPAEKVVADGTRNGAVFAGTYVASGSGEVLIYQTGQNTEFGSVAQNLQHQRPEPEFHRGVKRYGYLLMEFTFIMTMFIFAVNVWFHKPLVESFLFSLALAVGLTPQLLPAIMSITLAKGARELIKDKVVVKRLESIEDFGSMDVLCSDKTGTLTYGTVHVNAALNPQGADDPEVLRLAQVNASLQTGYPNPIDDELAKDVPPDGLSGITLIRTIPYDFSRKRVSVVVNQDAKARLIMKGAVESVLGCCTSVAGAQNLSAGATAVRALVAEYGADGMRVLGLATAEGDDEAKLAEASMTFVGLLVVEDPIREDAAATVAELKRLGVRLVVITGDNEHVAGHLAELVGLRKQVMTGNAVRNTPNDALRALTNDIDIYAEIDPIQKERLIAAHRAAGHVVGYIGDGINDGAALHAADVGISVAGAADVAKEAADLVMLEKGLAVLTKAVLEGRRIFANTLKYVFITTSANFGNMFSMAVASLFLPFLPMLPRQILLNNFLTDIPAATLAGDEVDDDLIEKPRRWDVSALRRFMLVYGLQSSVFDMLSFGMLLWFLHSTPDQFRTGWFMESAISELLILFVVRTKRPFFMSKPGAALLASCGAVAAIVLLLPLTPPGHMLGFVLVPTATYLAVGVVLALYTLTAELLKRKYLTL